MCVDFKSQVTSHSVCLPNNTSYLYCFHLGCAGGPIDQPGAKAMFSAPFTGDVSVVKMEENGSFTQVSTHNTPSTNIYLE